MPSPSPEDGPNDLFIQELNRRRLLIGVSVAAALGLATRPSLADQSASQPATPADQAQVDQLIALSKTLCGGGNFDTAQAATLLSLMSKDTHLSNGLAELLATTTTAATPAPVSDDAKAAEQAILLFWYTGYFNGDPLPDHAAIYDQLLAWQAMYTAPWAVCKVYGAWADPPATAPQVPENA
jgi:Membrane bound FAD containing D-sorbitol dehydrogenase